jgi:hypothetical protein
MTIPYGVIDDDGKLLQVSDENGTLVEIQGTLTCAGAELNHIVYAKVYPPKRTEQELLYQSIQQEVELADQKSSHTEMLELPQQANGKKLTWSGVYDNPWMMILVITVFLGIGSYLQMDSKVHQRAQERKSQLLLAYPDFMWKMTMLLGAGMSMKGALHSLPPIIKEEE